MANLLRTIILLVFAAGCSVPRAPANQVLDYHLLNGPSVSGPTDPHVVGDTEVVVEAFLTTKCGWCLKQIPLLEVLTALPKVRVVITFIWSEPEDVIAIVRDFNLPFAVLLADDLTSGASGTPHFVIHTKLTGEWEIGSHRSGFMEADELIDFVERFIP